jgi:hypothetical protein
MNRVVLHLDPTVDRQDLAAVTTLSSTLLCMDETLSKN